MAQQVHVYEFAEAAFVVGSDAVVCITPLSTVRPFMTLAEIDEAFSGYASFRQAPWMMRYVGVWGRKLMTAFHPQRPFPKNAVLQPSTHARVFALFEIFDPIVCRAGWRISPNRATTGNAPLKLTKIAEKGA